VQQPTVDCSCSGVRHLQCMSVRTGGGGQRRVLPLLHRSCTDRGQSRIYGGKAKECGGGGTGGSGSGDKQGLGGRQRVLSGERDGTGRAAVDEPASGGRRRCWRHAAGFQLGIVCWLVASSGIWTCRRITDRWLGGQLAMRRRRRRNSPR